MKTLKMNFLKMGLILSFVILVLSHACVQPGNKKSVQPENSSKVTSMAEKPQMDLQSAIISGNLPAVKQHIEAGTDIDKKDQMSGSTPLITAATFGQTNMVKALIDAKADMTLKNKDGATALHVAAFFCRVEIVQLLIDAKADKSAKNNFGATPRESVMGPFAKMKPIYEMLQQQLSPFGFQLDLNEVEKTRPVIAMMLQ